MRAQEKMGHSSMSEGWRDHTSPAQERVSWVMEEVMSGRMSQEDGMVEMARAHEDDARGSLRAHDPPRAPLGGVNMASRKANPTAARDALILEIAQRRFFIETLETRNRDRLDFHDVAVWAIRDALEEAFEAGRHTGAGAAPRPNPERTRS